MSDVTFSMKDNRMDVHNKRAEPWTVTLIDTGEDTMTGGRLRRIKPYVIDEDAFCFTYGDGGAVVTNDEELAKQCRMIANHGRIAKYDHEFEGRNSRLDGLQAAILSVKLKHLDKWTDHRIMIADEYLKQLKDVPGIILPIRKEWARQVYHLFVVRHPRRDELQDILQQAGVQTGVHYPIALPKLRAFKYREQENEEGFAWRTDRQLLSLPIDGSFDLINVEKIKGLMQF